MRKDGEKRLLEVRVISGTLSPGQQLKVVTSSSESEAFAPENLKELGDKGVLEEAAVAGPGDIVLVPVPASALPKEQEGERISCAISDAKRPFGPGNPDQARSGGRRGLRRGRCTFVLHLESLDKKERQRLLGALGKIEEEDDGLRLETCRETGETLLSVMGMLHLELLRERLAEDFKVLWLPLEQAHVAYQATLKSSTWATGSYAPAGKTKIRKGMVHVTHPDPDAWVKVELAPAMRGAGIQIEQEDDLKVSGEVREAMERGAREGLLTAGPKGIPIVDVSVKFKGAEAKGLESAAAAAAIAVQMAVQAAKRIALLEPVMEMEVDVPSGSASAVVGDLEKRLAEQIVTRESDAQTQIIDAEVPLRRVLGYSEDLHKMTSGKGSFTFHLNRYQDVDPAMEQEILEGELVA